MPDHSRLASRSEIIDRVLALKLPVEKYAVFGGAAMAMYNLRPTDDIDLLVTPELYQYLMRNEGWIEYHWPDGKRYLSRSGVEADDSCSYSNNQKSVIEVIKSARIMQGVPVAPLDEVAKWKTAFGRPKDLQDVALIDEYLRKPH